MLLLWNGTFDLLCIFPTTKESEQGSHYLRCLLDLRTDHARIRTCQMYDQHELVTNNLQ